MAIDCRIIRDEYGDIDYVIANNGERSILFDSLTDLVGGNKNAALDLYALTETQDFKDLSDLKSNEEKINFLKEFQKEKPFFGKDVKFQKTEIKKTAITPEEQKQEIINQLKKTGLASNVFEMSNDEIESKLQEIGIDSEVAKQVSKYHKSRLFVPNVRGGWTKEKIVKYFKSKSSQTVTDYGIIQMISEFDSFDDFKNNVFFHGTTNFIEKGLKPSITMSERDAERYGGGGYGERYFGISLTKDKKIAESFSGTSSSVKVYPVILKKDAKVVNREDLQDASDVEDIIVDLYEQGVDAVWIGGGEKELVVINPYAVSLYKNGSESFQVYGGFKSVQPTDKKLSQIFNKAKKEAVGLEEEFNSISGKENRDNFLSNIGKTQFSKTLSEKGIGVTTSGFTYKGDVYLNNESATENTSIHEFQHLHLDYLKENRKQVYEYGLSLIQNELTLGENSEIKEVIDFVNSTQPDLIGEKLHNEILTELLGRKGLDLIEETKDTVKKGGILEWLKNVWAEIKSMWGISKMSDAEVKKLTLGKYVRAMNVDILGGEKLIGDQAQEYFERNADRLPLTLSVFQRPEFIKLQGKDVNPITVLNSLNQSGIKQIEKELIKNVIEKNYQEQKKISYDELEATVRANIMPLERIFTSSYSDYGMDRLSDGNYGEATTIILNSPIDHGIVGHFSGSFIASGRKNIKYVPKQLNGNTWVAVEEGYESQANDNNIYQFVGTAGTKEAVDAWIENYDGYKKSLLSDAEIAERNDLINRAGNLSIEESRRLVQINKKAGIFGQGNEINKGMFGHIRVWQDGDIFNVAELQSDYFQKSNAKKDIVPNAPEYTKKLVELQSKYKKIAVENLKRIGITTREESLSSLNLSTPLQIRRAVESKAIVLSKSSEIQKLLDTIEEGLKSNDIEVRRQVDKDVSRVIEIVGKNPDITSNDSYIKELNQLKDNYLSLQEKQFIASQKEFEKRMVREAIKEASLSGATELRFPTPYTLSVIEGYLSENGSMPYEVESAEDSSRLERGDTIYYIGEEYTVLNSWYENIEVAQTRSLYSTDIDSFIEEQVISEVDEIMYYELDVDITKFYTQEEWDNEDKYRALEDTQLEDLGKEIEDGVYELSETKIRNLIEEDRRDYYNSESIESVLEDMGYENVFVSGDTAYYTPYGTSTETFGQPDTYDNESDKESFTIEGSLDDTQQTVARKYEQIAKILEQERGEDNFEIITDDSGFDWYSTKIEPSETNKPVVAFQKQEEQPTVTYKNSKVYSAQRINPITGKPTGEIELKTIETKTESRGLGQARAALKQFLNYTDALGKNVYLVVSPRDKQTRFTSLVDFYKSEGFRMEPTGFEMTRRARPVKPANFDSNEEADPKTVIEFSNQTDRELTNEEKIGLINFMLSSGVKSSKELLYKLEGTFFRNGVFIANKTKMSKSGLYNKFEISEIIGSPSIQSELKELILALRNTEEFFLEYENSFVKAQNVVLDNFGKQAVSNPYVLEKEIAKDIVGLPLENITEVLSSDLISKYNSDANFKQKIDKINAENKLAPVKVITDEGLVDKTTVTPEKVDATLIKEVNEDLFSKIVYLSDRVSEKVWNQNKRTVAKSIELITEQAKQNGIDFTGLSTKVYSKTRQEILDLLKSFANLVVSERNQNLEEFSALYDEMFDITEPQTEVLRTDSEFDIVLETALSEQELFSSHRLIRKSENVYRKVEEQTLDDLYESFFEYKNLFPSSVETLEQLKAYVQEKSADFTGEGFSREDGDSEKIWMYKKFFNFPLNIEEARLEVGNTKNVTLPSDYLTGDFVKEFNLYLLGSNNKYFKITDKGIELVNNDPISRMEAKLSIPESLKESLAQYDTISKHLNLGLESNLDNYEEFKSENEQRVYAVNNPNSVPKLTGEYTYIEEGILAAKNEPNTFVRTPIGVFELLYEMGNVKFFTKLPDSNTNYKISEIEKPLTDIDFNKYAYLQNTVDLFKESKNSYTKKELEQINKDYFSC